VDTPADRRSGPRPATDSPASRPAKAPEGPTTAPKGPKRPDDAAEPDGQRTAEPTGTTRKAADAWRDSDILSLPLPPAPPTERGYRPGDVERLVNLLADAITATDDGPRPDDISGVKLSRTFFIGQGYHIGAVEALRAAWVNELRRREL
jgi:hypothetical protein